MAKNMFKKPSSAATDAATPLQGGRRVPPTSAAGCVTGGKTFVWALTGSIFFLIASVLYVWLAYIGKHYESKVRNLPDEVWEADDDYTFYEYGWTDDYVMEVGSKPVWVSRYQVVYSAAALGFVITGLIDFVFKPGCFGASLLLAGVFGLASAMASELEDDKLSNVFNSVSVHLFALEAIQVLFYRSVFPGLEIILRIGDGCFVVGSLMDVALSYMVLSDGHGHNLSVFDIVAAFLWVVTAVVYVGSTLYIQKRGGFDEGDSASSAEEEEEEEDVITGDKRLSKPYVAMEMEDEEQGQK